MNESAMPRFLTVADAAARLGLPRKTVYGWTYKGIISCVHIGGRVLIPIEDLERELEKGRRASVTA
tara:strand:- start:90 stop:287 length:198 start_codon:yes stop_codon:yes gene_type:complete